MRTGNFVPLRLEAGRKSKGDGRPLRSDDGRGKRDDPSSLFELRRTSGRQTTEGGGQKIRGLKFVGRAFQPAEVGGRQKKEDEKIRLNQFNR
jgi:hypothetical protein